MLGLSPALAYAHEYWLEPETYRLQIGEQLRISLRNGEDFKGFEQIYNDGAFKRFERIVGDAVLPVVGRLGDRPALTQDVGRPGLQVIVYQSTGSIIEYKKWEKFERFSQEKDLGDVETRHQARDLPGENFKEYYTRYAKSLVGVDDAAGRDRQVGLEMELVALQNPYAEPLTEMPALLLYQGEPLAQTQVTLFEKAPGEPARRSLHRTDADGLARLPIRPGAAYLVDAVALREPSPEIATRHGAVWETLWASLTFEVPAR